MKGKLPKINYFLRELFVKMLYNESSSVARKP